MRYLPDHGYLFVLREECEGEVIAAVITNVKLFFIFTEFRQTFDDKKMRAVLLYSIILLVFGCKEKHNIQKNESDDLIRYHLHDIINENEFFIKKMREEERLKDYRNELDSVHSLTSKINKQFYELRTNLINNTGGLNEDGDLMAKNTPEVIKDLIWGIEKEGAGYKLESMLNAYSNYIIYKGLTIPNSDSVFAYIALPGSTAPIYKFSKKKELDFVDSHFRDKSLAEVLEVLTILQLRMNDLESNYIKSVLIK